MKTTILKCKLKPEVPSGTVVYLERRTHNTEFEILNPGEGVEYNVGKLCDIKVVTKHTQEVADNKPIDEASKELLEFASDSWNLAIKFEKQLKALQEKYDKVTAKKAIAKKATPRKARAKKE